MTAHTFIRVEDPNAEAEREKRVQLALLRGMVESIKSNRLVVPVFGLAVCAMFPQWVGLNHLAGWYIQVLVGMVPQLIVLSRIPPGTLSDQDLRKWSLKVAAACLHVGQHRSLASLLAGR